MPHPHLASGGLARRLLGTSHDEGLSGCQSEGANTKMSGGCAVWELRNCGTLHQNHKFADGGCASATQRVCTSASSCGETQCYQTPSAAAAMPPKVGPGAHQRCCSCRCARLPHSWDLVLQHAADRPPHSVAVMRCLSCHCGRCLQAEKAPAKKKLGGANKKKKKTKAEVRR